jgi:hypothetical protein
MAEVRVYGNTHHLHAPGLKFLQALVEGYDLGWAHKSEVKRIKEQQNMLAAVIGQLKLFVERIVGHYRRCCEFGCCLGYLYGHLHAPSADGF